MAAAHTAAEGEAPPPTYAPTQPQILVTPLPDLASFFWGRTVQGEVFVKGLGEGGSRGVASLTVALTLDNHLPTHPTISLHSFAPLRLYPGDRHELIQSSSSTTPAALPFPTSHRFAIPLPSSLATTPPAALWDHQPPLPGTLDLSSAGRGEVRWSLTVALALLTGDVISETVRVEGTPEELGTADEGVYEVEERLDKDGARARLVLNTDTPRLGDLLRAGVEIKPKERGKTGLAGLVAQPDPAETLRPLRRVRVELYRRIDVMEPSSSSSSAVSQPILTLLHSTGKSLRYPGAGHSPLRVLFTLRTAGLGGGADPTWGEITSTTAYHAISFFVRVTFGFGATMDPATPSDRRDWVIERPILIRPRRWIEPTEVLLVRGLEPSQSMGLDDHDMDEDTRAAYRLKGRDVVGANGTVRLGADGDMPPPFESEAGPSSLQADGLPTFVESEAQARSGEAPLAEPVRTERLAAVFDGNDGAAPLAGLDSELQGELGSWVEYDGYETFSVAPPPVAASYGVGSSMDPPREGDEIQETLMGGIATRLGLAGDGGVQPTELMDQLGLGEGTRVVDLHDDLPPGIDEPSMPALPGFRARPFQQGFDEPPPPPPDADHPPSFDASEAAVAAGGVARSRAASAAQPASEAPPGYFGGGPPAYS